MATQSGIYKRPTSENERPRLPIRLVDKFPDQSKWFRNFGRGTYFHHEALERLAVDVDLDVELVPEPGNPFDKTAVSLDVNRNRVGYLSSRLASSWHDVVAAANRAGVELFIPGRIEGYEGEEADEIGLEIHVPTFGLLDALGKEFGLNDECHKLLEGLDESTRQLLLDSIWDQLPTQVIQELRNHKSDHSLLSWPSGRQQYGDGPQVPGYFVNFIREQVVIQRAESRRLADQERERRRIEREVEKQAKKARSFEKASARAALQVEVVRLNNEGMTQKEVALAVSISPSKVASLLKGQVGRTPSNFNENERAKRRTKAFAAVKLQRQGLTRAAIATEIGVSPESVKELLRDGKFYENPDSNQARVEFANECQLLNARGLTKIEISKSLGATTPRVTEGLRDSAAISE